MTQAHLKRSFIEKHIFTVGILAFFLLFFLRMHPLIIFDNDDWLYIAYRRLAIPIWEHWNPGRVTPEIMMPFLSLLGTKLLMPFTNDLVSALAITFGVVLSLVVTAYFTVFRCFLRKKMSLSDLEANLLAVLFVILHFLVFRKTMNSDNLYMLHSIDVTCYFYYTIPTLLNIMLVMLLELRPDTADFSRNSTREKMILCFCAYFGVFSNLFGSHVLAIWAGLKLLTALFADFRQVFTKRFWRANGFWILLLLLWAISALYETSGARAESFEDRSLRESLVLTLKEINKLRFKVNSQFMLFAGLAVLFGVPAFFLSGKQNQSIFPLIVQLAAFSVLTIIYLILLCAKSKPTYISRADVLLSFFWGCSTILIFLAVFVVKKWKTGLILLPIYLVFLVSATETVGVTFRESSGFNGSWQYAAELDRGMIQQVIDAEQKGMTECVIEIPAFYSEGYLAQYGGDRVGTSLYSLGIIRYPIHTSYHGSTDMDSQYVYFNQK